MFSTPTFSTLESAWDHSTRRGWTTLASFAMQAFGLSLLVAISLIWVERPPQVRWLQFAAPAAFTAPVAAEPAGAHHNDGAADKPRSGQVITPWSVPRETPRINDAGSGPTVADAPGIDLGPGTGPGAGVVRGLGDGMPIVIPARPAPVKPLLVSHWAEGNLIHRVQPVYPPLARQVRIQGTVELRAIVSKAGTIENLTVVSGHPMLVKSAMEAVRQWRYRPYLLNGDPIEVETDVTVNFVLSGG
jgi:periplasmic protein TonB